MIWKNFSDTKNLMNGPNYKLEENLNNRLHKYLGTI